MGNKAKYYKCALQVNSYSYANFRGNSPQNEVIYNQEIVNHCKKNNISVVGLADHGSIDSSESLRNSLTESGIIVFPGFEISSAEKIHMVCLFPPEYDSSKLNRIIGSLGLSDVNTGTEASSETCLSISKKVSDNGGFWYAAHITGDNGILKIGKMNHIWKNDSLVAAQIPASKDEIDPNYKNIIKNNDPEYKRTHPLAYINASDIEKAEDLDKENSSVLVKMSSPNFKNFCMAFKDPESRIRLNSEKESNYQSCIENIKISGGYLDGLDIDLSENLATIIGGRGTGKSTLIGAIRYALGKEPIGREAYIDFNNMIKQNFGSGSIIELSVVSNAQHGQRFNIKKRYNQNSVIKKEDGSVSPMSVKDILPSVEIYGQNEIMEIARDNIKIKDVAKRLFPIPKEYNECILREYNLILENHRKIDALVDKLKNMDSSLEELPRINEKLEYYKDAGLEEKLTIFKELSSEEGQFSAIEKSLNFKKLEFPKIELSSYKNNELILLSEKITKFNYSMEELNSEYSNLVDDLKKSFYEYKNQWELGKSVYDNQLKSALKSIEGIQDMTSQEIVNEYSNLIKFSEECKPLSEQKKINEKNLEEEMEKRVTLIENYKTACDKRNKYLDKAIKKINKNKLSNTVKISIRYRQNKSQLISYITENISGIGEKLISGIHEYDDFDIFTFAEDCRKGEEHLRNKYNLTSKTSEKLSSNLSQSQLMDIEEIELEDIIDIELNVNGKFKKLKDLSKGQQCTAILNLLLIDNKDPLIIDQPEDNLDNSFIAENLVKTLRKNKIKRQYILATHNANIPVFGDSEQIITMEESDGKGQISLDGLGSIDDSNVKKNVISILEGGSNAFKMREIKYGLKEV